MRKLICAALTAAALGTGGCGSATATHPTHPVPAAKALHLAQPLPVAMAKPPSSWHSRPPRRVTPGAKRHDPLSAICPQVSTALQTGPVSAAAKTSVLAEYGITGRQRHSYRIDHLVPRELDGSNAIRNLWPQLARGFRIKNRTEDVLHSRVCGGQLTLRQAQRLIRRNWVLAYRQYAAPRPKPRKPEPSPTASAPSAPSAPPSAPPTASPPPPSPACYPLSSSGNCYEPGEFCSDADHGASGVAGDGKAITCEDNDGWRWEPTG